MPAEILELTPKTQVDVLMTVYNGAAYLESSIKSLLGQTFNNFLLHVVDDGSTDDTAKILSDLARSDSRLRIHTKQNGGIVEASNFGLSYCESEFVARQDADDISYPDRLQRQVDILSKRPDIVAISGNAHRIDERGSRLPNNLMTPPPESADFDFIPAIEPFLIHTLIMFRREAIVRVGGYRHLPVSEDSDLFWRLQEIGNLYSDDVFYGQYRMNSQSISSKSIENGRVMAVCSQLSALSAKRRRSGASDLTFDQGLARELGLRSHALEDACEAMADQLTSAERLHLRFAASIKLMDMAGYRPYKMQHSDYRFISKLRKECETSASIYNQKLIRRNLSGVAAQLASTGSWADVRVLLYSRIYIPFAMKYASRVLLPERLRVRLRAMFRSDKRV